MSDKRLVLDLETKRTFDDVGSRNNLAALGVSVVGIYNYDSDDYRCFLEHEFGELQNLLIDSTLIIGFNHIHFDLPVLQPHLSIDTNKLPCFDILVDVEKRIGHRVGLDAIARATLGVGKTASGLDAIRYYQENRWEELKTYCLNDVKVTKEVFNFGLKEKTIKYHTKYGQNIKEVRVDWGAYTKRKASTEFFEKPLEPAQYKLF